MTTTININRTTITDKSFNNDYIFIKRIITICFKNLYYLSHYECDMIFNFLYPCKIEFYNQLSLSQLGKIEKIKQLLEKYKVVIPECYHYNYLN